MSLAYALEAAINGSTGPHATLSHGLSAHQASPASIRALRILTPQGWPPAARDAVA